MFLSRLILNPRSHAVCHDIEDPYQMHRTVSRAFGHGSRGEPGRILWRCDSDNPSARVIVYVQSEIAPDWNAVVEYSPDYFEDTFDQNPACREISQQQFTFPEGTLLSFRLRANPTKKIMVEGKKHGCRVPLLKADQQLKWLKDKAEAGGFQLVMANITAQRKYICKPGPQKNGPDKRQITLESVVFDGTLQVTDGSAFWQTITAGIGSAKGMGMGLLSLAPAR